REGGRRLRPVGCWINQRSMDGPPPASKLATSPSGRRRIFFFFLSVSAACGMTTVALIPPQDKRLSLLQFDRKLFSRIVVVDGAGTALGHSLRHFLRAFHGVAKGSAD